MQITYSTDKSVERDGVRYYLTYFTTLDCGYVSEENLTQDPNAVIAEKVVYVRTPQNLRLAKDSIELGTLLEKGTQLQVLGYEGTTNGVVDLYEVPLRRLCHSRRARRPARRRRRGESGLFPAGKGRLLPTTRCRAPATPSI